jgi:hypothetical protein
MAHDLNDLPPFAAQGQSGAGLVGYSRGKDWPVAAADIFEQGRGQPASLQRSGNVGQLVFQIYLPLDANQLAGIFEAADE